MVYLTTLDEAQYKNLSTSKELRLFFEKTSNTTNAKSVFKGDWHRTSIFVGEKITSGQQIIDHPEFKFESKQEQRLYDTIFETIDFEKYFQGSLDGRFYTQYLSKAVYIPLMKSNLSDENVFSALSVNNYGILYADQDNKACKLAVRAFGSRYVICHIKDGKMTLITSDNPNDFIDNKILEPKQMSFDSIDLRKIINCDYVFNNFLRVNDSSASALQNEKTLKTYFKNQYSKENLKIIEDFISEDQQIFLETNPEHYKQKFVLYLSATLVIAAVSIVAASIITIPSLVIAAAALLIAIALGINSYNNYNKFKFYSSELVKHEKQLDSKDETVNGPTPPGTGVTA